MIAVFDIAGPLVAYSLLRSAGQSAVIALVLSGAFPALGVLAGLIRHRRVDAIGVLVLAGIAVGTVLGLLSGDPRLVLVEGSVPTAVFGLLCLGSLWASRPLIYRFAIEFIGADTPKGREFESLWRYPGLPTELPVWYRQNCFGDLFLSIARGSDSGSGRRAGLFTGCWQPGRGVLAAWGVAAAWLVIWSVVAVGAAGCQPSGRWLRRLVRRRRARRAGPAWSLPVRARQARILRMLAAMSSSAVNREQAAMPRTRRRPGWARAWWAGSLA